MATITPIQTENHQLIDLPPSYAPVEKGKKPRIYYIDHLRTWLTFLVVIHHCIWVVVAEWTPFNGGWSLDTPTVITSYMVLSGDQAYFMGLFFFLSGLVTGPSLKRKGDWVFLKDRIIRLLIPIVLYELVIFPLLFYFAEVTWNGPQRGSTATMRQVFDYYFDIANYRFLNNHLWFPMLLYFFNQWTVIILSIMPKWREFILSYSPKESISTKTLVVLLVKMASLMFVLTFVLRIPFPSGYLWIPVFANLAFLGQYLVAFIAGMIANSYKYLDCIPKEALKVILPVSIVLYFLFQIFQTYLYLPLLNSVGFYAHTFLITIFEQFYAAFFSCSVLIMFREYQNKEPSFIFKKLIGSAYATYIVHQWIIIPIAIGLAYAKLYPMLVILILCLTAPFLSFGAGVLLKAIPGADIIL